MEEKKLNQDLYTSLRGLGLTEQEIRVYTTSLSLGPSPISAIAKSTGISRPNVYKVIRGLEKRGLASLSQKNKYSRDFMIESPTILLEKLREKKRELEQLDENFVTTLPDLLSLYHQGGAPTKVKVIQGKDLYLKIYNQSLEESGGEILYFGSTNDFINFISWEREREWIKKRVKKDIFVKVLSTPGDAAAELKSHDASEMRETRILKSTPFIASFQLFANKVIIWQPETPLAILIEDEYIVAMLKSIFGMLWEISE
jgi:sugar-specific transcriptional regulator TrmB